MPNVEHILHKGKIHIKLGSKTACGEDLTKNPEHWKTVSNPVNCKNCEKTRN